MDYQFSEAYRYDHRVDFPAAWKKGHDACLMVDGDADIPGLKVRNPYPRDTPERIAWNQGWNYALFLVTRDDR